MSMSQELSLRTERQVPLPHELWEAAAGPRRKAAGASAQQEPLAAGSCRTRLTAGRCDEPEVWSLRQ